MKEVYKGDTVFFLVPTRMKNNIFFIYALFSLKGMTNNKIDNTQGRRASVDTPFVIIVFILITLITMAFFVRYGNMLSESPGEHIGGQLVSGQISEVDIRAILKDAYLKASAESGASGGKVSQNVLFESYATEWIQKYFRQRGIYNTTVQILRGTVPVKNNEFSGYVTTLQYGSYNVSISTSQYRKR